MRLLLLLLLAPIFAFSQLLNNNVMLGGTTGSEKAYVPIPAPPTFGTTTLLEAATVGSSVESGETGGNTDLLVETTFAERLRPNGLVGTEGTPYRFKSQSDAAYSVVGGDVLTVSQRVAENLNSSNWNLFYHLKLTGDSDYTVGGVTGMAWFATAGGVSIGLSDIIITNTSFAGFQVQSSTGTYDSIGLEFIKIEDHQGVLGMDTGGEGVYIGNTSKTTYAVVNVTDVNHMAVFHKARDLIQANNHLDFYASNVTGYIGGGDSTAGQRALVQFQNGNYVLENFILDGAPNFCDISSHNVTFRNGYFRWNNSAGFVADHLAAYGSPIGLVNNPAGGGTGKILFDNCTFVVDQTTTNVLQVNDPNVDIEFLNCTFDDDFTNLYLDNRGASNYSLIGTITTNGNVRVDDAMIPLPEYSQWTDIDADDWGLITDDYWYGRGCGNRTPLP